MKKSSIALSVIGLLGAVTVGGSYFSGKVAEEKFNDYIAQTNLYLQKHNSDVVSAEIKEVKFERHWFSSDVSFTLEFKLNNESMVIKSDDKLYHGPFPLNRVMLGKLMPVAGSLESNINSLGENTLFTAPLSGTARTDLGYNGSYSGVATFNPNKGQYQDVVFEFDKTTATFDSDNNFNGTMTYQMPSLKYSISSNPLSILFEDFELQAELKNVDGYRFIGNNKFDTQVKSIKVVTPESNDIILENVQSKGSNKIENGRFITQNMLNANVKLAHLEKTASIGKINFDLNADLDAKTYDDLNEALISFNTTRDLANVDKNVEQLLTKQPKLNLKTLSLENEKGKNNLSLTLNLDKLPSEQIKSLKEALSIFKQSTLDVVLNLPASEEMMKQLYLLEPAANEQVAQNVVAATLNAVKEQAQQSGLFIISESDIKAKLEINNGEVKLNDKVVPEKDLEMIMFMLMMGLAH